jgi:hypothetical protein
MADYEVWLLDEFGERITLIDNFSFLAYSRNARGVLATVHIGVPFHAFRQKVNPYFLPDRRLEIWRSPQDGYPLRREGMFLLRKYNVYSREDGMAILELWGRSPLDLLRRRHVIQQAGTNYTAKTDEIDDMMKAIVRQQMLYDSALDENGVSDNTRAFPQHEFSVQVDKSLGPSVTLEFADRNVLEVLQELKDLSIQKNRDSSANHKILFDMVIRDLRDFEIFILDADSEIALDEAGDGLLDETSIETSSDLGFEFQTFADLIGSDRTDDLEFSEDNGNLRTPSHSVSHLDEVNVAYAKGQGAGESRQTEEVVDTPRAGASRWNRVETIVDASGDVDAAGLQNAGRAELGSGIPIEILEAIILNTPGGDGKPRSLYGVDWDMGDLLRVNYADKQFDVEVVYVYISLNDVGEENIVGRNVVDESV